MASPFASHAPAMICNGYSVIAIRPGMKSPIHKNWSKWCSATAPDHLISQWSRLPRAGIGIALGYASVVSLDIDTDEQDIIDAVLELTGASPAERVGNTGFAAFFRIPAESMIAREWWVRAATDTAPKAEVDLRGMGHQVVLPPSVHPDTDAPYFWRTQHSLDDTPVADLPELDADICDKLNALLVPLGFARNAGKEKEPALSPTTCSTQPVPMRSADMCGHLGGLPINDTAIANIDAWFPMLGLPKTRQRGTNLWSAVASWRPSGKGRPDSERNPNLGASEIGIRDFGTGRSYSPVDLVCAARNVGIVDAANWLETMLNARREIPDWLRALTCYGVAVFGTDDTTQPEPEPEPEPKDGDMAAFFHPVPPAFPARDLAKVSCENFKHLSRTVQAISVQCCPNSAFAGALSLIGICAGKNYEGATKLRTNFYIVITGRSGWGKTNAIKSVAELLRGAGLGILLGAGDYSSGVALIRRLAKRPKFISIIDEFGKRLIEWTGKLGQSSSAWNREMLSNILKLYSAANGTFESKAYNDERMDLPPIDEPHYAILGTSTERDFYASFSGGNADDGSIARFITIPMQGRPEFKDATHEGLERAVEILNEIATPPPGSGNLAAFAGSAGNTITVPCAVAPYSDAAGRMINAARDRASELLEHAEDAGIRGAPSILNRVAENAAKIALAHAVCRDPQAPVIDTDDAEFGLLIAWWNARTMIAHVGQMVSDNEHESVVNDIHTAVVRAGDKGVSRRTLRKSFRKVQEMAFDNVMKQLQSDGSVEIVVSTHQGAGRPVMRYVASEFCAAS